ncbi:MAG: aminotransferase class I/II-fold pyridoxal phosphate-dependent enzyme [Oscillospiraceae bacterium]|nr:aminotransferase class I/II-fold pyridoxal phosphate-dependent enzyme [Oscillospiraceae bacterium]
MKESSREGRKTPGVFFSQTASLNNKKIGFHVPGHIGARFFDDRDCRRLIDEDTTELSSTDDLHDPKGPVLESLRFAAEVFGSAYSFFLCSGTTTGLRIMLSAVLDEASVLLTSRPVHMSVVWTLSIIGCKYLFLPHKDPGLEGSAPLSMADAKEMEDYLAVHPEITDILITSPDYYGRCANLCEYAKVAHRHGCRLLVDEAHGAHFAFGGDSFPETAMKAGADIAVQSLHKTLPALTPAAILHVSEEAQASGRVSRSRIAERLRIYETSSPSFTIAASSDMAIRRMKQAGPEVFERTAKQVRLLAGELRNIPGISVDAPTEEFTFDPLRLTIHTEASGYYAPDIRDALERRGIFIEFADPVRLLAIFSVLHEDREFESFSSAMRQIMEQPEKEGLRRPEKLSEISRLMTRAYAGCPEQVMPLREAVFARRGASPIQLSASAGRVCASPVAFYPPGIPVIWPGEKVPAELTELLFLAQGLGLSLTGLSDGLFVPLDLK